MRIEAQVLIIQQLGQQTYILINSLTLDKSKLEA